MYISALSDIIWVSAWTPWLGENDEQSNGTDEKTGGASNDIDEEAGGESNDIDEDIEFSIVIISFQSFGRLYSLKIGSP